MKKLFTLIVGLAFSFTGVAQPCLPEGIYFYTQNEVDSFQVNHPFCTQIDGTVGINGDVANLDGLSVITEISGDLRIEYTLNLVDLSGLDNLTSVGGDVYISNNESLVNITGLGGLITLGGNLNITSNNALLNLSGLTNLTSINTLYIYDNALLTDLSGLSNFNYVGQLIVQSNIGLDNLMGLENLSTVGDLWVLENPNLTSLAGLENITSIHGGLELVANEMLTDLTALGNLTNVENQFWIENNTSLSDLTGLNNLTSVASLYINYNPLLPNLAGLSSLDSIETDIKIIGNNSLENFTGLNSLTYIGGLVEIGSIYGDPNPVLTSLAGLENVEAGSIDNLIIRNNPSLSTCDVQSICDYLASPSGTIEIHDNATGCNSQAEVEAACLNNCLSDDITFSSQAQIDSFQVNYPTCTEIQGSVTIWGGDIVNLDGLINITKISGYLEIRSNPELTNLAGLINVTHIGGTLEIRSCFALTSIDGIKNIDASSITNLHIVDNTSLSECAVQSVCDYLANPNGFFEIYGNGSGCGSEGEVFYQCVEDVDESQQIDNFTIFPNPSTDAITIILPITTSGNSTTLSVSNINAQQVISRRISEPITVLDIDSLPCGVYFARITNDRTVMVSKFIKQ